MSVWDTPNRDAYTVLPGQATQGKTLDLMEGFKAAWDVTVRDASMFGIQEVMRNKDDAQIDTMRKAGIENVPSLSRQSDDPMRMFTDFGQDYLDTARFYEDGGDPAMAYRLSQYDEQIAKYQKQYPQLNLMTSAEMWDSTRQEAQAAERLASRQHNFGGSVGAFVGGMAGYMNPNTSPINFASIPIGGFGRNVLTRVAAQAGIQGVAQAGAEFNQWTGISEQRRLLGLDVGNPWERIGQAAAGGAAGQGFGEIVGFGLRRVFRSTPKDIVPEALPDPKEPLPDPSNVPPGVVAADESTQVAALIQEPARLVDSVHEVSPWSTNRAGRARTVIDLDYTTRRLEDWSGERPWEMPPKTDTAPIRPQSDFELPQDVKELAKERDINALMHKADPETMGKWDAAASDKQTARTQLEMATTDAERAVSTEQTQRVQSLTTQIASLDAKIANVGAMKAKKLKVQRAELEAQRDAALKETAVTDSQNMAVIRRRVMEADEKMRDLAPLVTRAKVRAQNRWEANGDDYDQVIEAMNGGRFEDTAGTTEPILGVTKEDLIPQLQRAQTLEKPLKHDADAADVVQAVVKQDVATYTEAAEAAMTRIKALLKKADDLDEAPEKPAELRAKAAELRKAGDVEGADKAEQQATDLENAKEIAVAGHTETLNLDTERFTVEQRDGSLKEATLREHLQDQLNDQEDLEAVSSCSVL